MAQQMISIGAVANDGNGDNLRVAGGKINDNFTELYASVAAAGATWKTPVRVATTSTKVLASEVENGDTIDGVVITTGDRVLLKNQTAPAENGIYVVAASGAPTRASDADSSAELVNAAVLVSEGTTNADKLFVCTTNAPITVGTTALTWADFSPASATYAPTAVSSQTGTSYTAVLGDANTYIRFSNASAITFTIPPNSSVAFPVGTVIEMEQAGAGALSVAAGAGVTINSRSSDLTLAGQYAVAFVKKVATDTWTMNGDL